MLYVGVLEQKYVDLRHRAVMVFLAITLVGALVAFALAFFISEKISISIKKLAAAAEQVAHGNLDARVEIRSHDELRGLADTFNFMAAALKKRDDKLREFTTTRILESERLAHIGQLAAGVAHEINNPINGIINYAQILVDRSEDGSVERDLAGRMLKEGDRIDHIVAGLLSFARRRQNDKSVVSIPEVLSDTMTLNAAQLRKDNITVRTCLSDALPDVWAQPQEISQVFVNVISNARHALNKKYLEPHEDKILEITAEPIAGDSGRQVRIRFKDHGCGIPAAILHKVMDPFFSTKTERRSTGLGLSISHAIVEEHGGRLRLESEEGRYTEVVIELPACDESNR